MFSGRDGGHLKKQGDSAVVDGGRDFVGANHHSGRRTVQKNLWEQAITVGGGQFRGKPYQELGQFRVESRGNFR